MKYYFKENFRLLYADGTLYDEQENPVYQYQNTTLLFPEIELYRDGELVGHVKKNFTLFLREYDIYLGDELADTLGQDFTFFHPELTLERLGWTIKGDFFALDYEIRNAEGTLLCEVNQELFRLTRRYYVNIYDEENEELLVLLVLAINQFDKDLSSSQSSAHTSSHSNGR